MGRIGHKFLGHVFGQSIFFLISGMEQVRHQKIDSHSSLVSSKNSRANGQGLNGNKKNLSTVHWALLASWYSVVVKMKVNRKLCSQMI